MTIRKKQVQDTLRITQVGSRIGNQERVVRVLTDGLGLGRIGSSVVLPDNPYTRGMIAKVVHMVRVEEIPAPAESRHIKDEVAVEAAVEAPTAAPKVVVEVPAPTPAVAKETPVEEPRHAKEKPAAAPKVVVEIPVPTPAVAKETPVEEPKHAKE